jgi:hypothetical protein
MGASDHLGAPNTPVVLVVEDDPDVRALAAAISADRTSPRWKRRGEDALAFLRDRAPDVRLILSDFELPKVLVTSGVHDIPENVNFLPEPWRAADVRAHLQWESERGKAARARNPAEDYQEREGGLRVGRFQSDVAAAFMSQPSTMVLSSLSFNSGRRLR